MPALVAVLVVVLLAVAVLFLGRDASLEALRARPFSDRNVVAAVDVLARSGVGTYAEPTDVQPMRAVSAPASPLALLRDQVRAMALEASAGGGIPGTELDALFEPDEELPPASYVLTGYVKEADTPAAELARRLMGEQDWERASDLVYPQLVLVLFTADVIRARAADEEGRAAEFAGLSPAPVPIGRPMAMVEPMPPLPPLAAEQVGFGPCSAVQNFIDTTLRRVFNALRLGESRGVGGLFAKIWNFVVNALEVVVTRLIKAVTQKVVDMIARVAAVVGTVASVVSAIRPWTVTVNAEPFTREKGIVNVRPGEQGALVARVDLGGLDEWPSWAQDCATVAGQPLPNLRPEGAPVLWGDVIQHPPGLVGVDGAAPVLDAQGSARLDFTTLVDDVSAPYQTLPGAIGVNVTVEREGLRQLSNIVERQLLAELPSFVANAVYGPLLKPQIDRIVSRLSQLISVSGSGPGIVLFHVEEPTPPPTAEPTPRLTPRPTPRATPRPGTPRPGGETRPDGRAPCGPCGTSTGDPHFITVSGHGYSLQSAGEFVLFRSPDDAIEVQGRHEPYPGRDDVTITTAAAVRAGVQRFAVYMDLESNAVRALLDGEQMGPGTSQGLDGDAWLSHDETDDIWFVDYADGSWVYITGLAGYGLNVAVRPSDDLVESGLGLMAAVHDGSLLPPLPDGTSIPRNDDLAMRYQDKYVTFTEAWRISADESLFDYAPGASTETFTIRGFPLELDVVELADLSAALRRFGEAACIGVNDDTLREQCVFDVAITGDDAFATVYERTQRFVDPSGLRPSGTLVRLVNVYADEGGPTDVDIYGYALTDDGSEELVSPLATVPYGQASAWFDPGLYDASGFDGSKLEVFRRGDTTEPLFSVRGSDLPRDAGAVTTVAISSQVLGEGERRPSWELAFEAHPRGHAERFEAPPGEGVVAVNGLGWPSADGSVGDPVYPGAGTECLYLWVAANPSGFKGPSSMGRGTSVFPFGISVGAHELAMHEAYEQELTADGIRFVCDQRVGPSVPVEVRDGDRFHLFIYAPTPEEEFRLLLLPFGR